MLVNAGDRANLYPESFKVPSDEDIQKIQVGQAIKVCADGHRFWLRVTGIQLDINCVKSAFIAKPDVELVSPLLDESIEVKPEHIFDIEDIG